LVSGFTYVYVIRHEQGFLKIGRADDPIARRDQIQTSSPYEIDLWKVALCSNDADYFLDYPHMEDYLHSEFSDSLVRGEWFDADPGDVLEVMEDAVGDDSLPGIRLVDAQDRIDQARAAGRKMSEVFK